MILGANWEAVGAIVAAILFGGYKMVRGLKEWKARKRGLAGNPARCEDHESRLRRVEGIIPDIGKDIAIIKTDISWIKDALKD